MKFITRWLLVAGASLPPGVTDAAVVVHGLGHDHLGSAVVSVVTDASGRSCSVTNIGSSGQDGVSIDLAQTQGLLLQFGPPPLAPAPPVTDCRLTPRVGIGSPLPLATLHCSKSAGSVGVSLDVGVAECVVEVWSGTSLECSATRPTSGQFANLIDSNLNLCDDRFLLGLRTVRSRDDGVVKRSLEFSIHLANPCPIQVAGSSFTGDEVVVRCSVPNGLALSLVDAQLLMTCPGGGGSAALDAEHCGMDPASKAGVPRPSTCFVSGISGVQLTASSTPGQLVLGSDGTSDPQAVRLNGLPPGEPYVWREISGALSTPTASAGSIAACAWSSHCVWDPLDGTPAVIHDTDVTWSSSDGGKFWQHQVYSDDPFTPAQLHVYGGGTVITISGSNFFSSNRPPAQCRTRCSDGLCAVSLVTTGAQITLDGNLYTPDSVVVVDRRSSGQATGLSEVQVLQPSGSPPLTLLACAAVPMTQGLVAGGRWTFANGPRQTVSLDGSRRLPVHNLGSSGQDGVEIRLSGNPSVDVPFSDPLPGEIHIKPERIEMKVYDCDDGSCAPNTVLSCLGLDTGSNLELRLTCPDPSTAALFVEAGGHYVPFAVADVDGDGWPDLQVTSPPGTGLARLQYRGFTSSCDRWVVDTQGPVVVRTGPGTSVTVSEVTVWRNREKFMDGEIPTQEDFVRVTGVPPGIPVGGTLGVCDIAIDEPGVQLAACVADGNPGSLGGQPVVETFGKVSGHVVVVTAQDACGGVNLEIPYPEVAFSSDEPTITADSRGPGARGFATQVVLPATATSDDYSDVEVKLSGVWGSAPSDLWSLRMRTNPGSDSLRVREYTPGIPPPRILRVYSSGVLQGTFHDVGDVTCDGLPTVMVAGGDLDGDGAPDLKCSGFPGGNRITINGASFACDRAEFSDPQAPAVTSVDECGMMVHKIHRGNGLSSARIATIPGPGGTVDVPPTTADLPLLALAAAAPNPFASGTTLRLSMRSAGTVRVRVIDLAGREIARLADGRFPPGEHLLRWNGLTRAGAAAPAGVYFVRVERDGMNPLAARVTRLR